MAGLFGSKAAIQPAYTGLDINTYASILPVPLVYGQTRRAPNMIWTGDFTVYPAPSQNGGKGGGKGGGGSPGYLYAWAMMLVLCEGPVAPQAGVYYGPGRFALYYNRTLWSPSQQNVGIMEGAYPSPIFSWLTTEHPTQAIAYNGVVMAVSSSFPSPPSSSPDMGNVSFELAGVLAGTGFNGVDADPAQMLEDLVNNQFYGAASAQGASLAFDVAQLLTQTPGDGSYQSYCAAAGLALSANISNQESALSIIQRWLKLTNSAGVWSAGSGLKIIPYGDEAITGGTRTITETRQIPLSPNDPWPIGPTTPGYPYLYTLPPVLPTYWKQWVSDGGVIGPGGAMTYVSLGSVPVSGQPGGPAQGQYGIIDGQYYFNEIDAYGTIDITYSYNAPGTFAPNTAPVYSLTDDDYLDDGKGDSDPVTINRSDPFQAFNIVRLQVRQRDNQYAMVPVESRDQNAIELYGPRIDTSVQADEICDQGIAATVGQLLVQRSVYQRNTVKFKLSWEFAALEPMDVLALTQTPRLNNAPFRITTIEEDDDGFLSVEAEEFLAGVGSVGPMTAVGSQAASRSGGSAAPAVTQVLIIEPPSDSGLALGAKQIWFGACGGDSTNWAGCYVWLSLDGISFGNAPIGTIAGPATMGLLSSLLPKYSGSNPDTADTLSVSTALSGGVLQSVSAANAAAGNPLMVIDSELLAFETATLTGPNTYNLTNLYRGLYSTTVGEHLPGATFALIPGSAPDQALNIFQWAIPGAYFGLPLYFKFQSFNGFGQGVQDLSDCAVYAYAQQGILQDHPVARAMIGASQGGIAIDLGDGSGGTGVALTDDFGTGNFLELEVDLGS